MLIIYKMSTIYKKDNMLWPSEFILEAEGWLNIWKSTNIVCYINKPKKKIYPS
jgi:hypothetical protein